MKSDCEADEFVGDTAGKRLGLNRMRSIISEAVGETFCEISWELRRLSALGCGLLATTGTVPELLNEESNIRWLISMLVGDSSVEEGDVTKSSLSADRESGSSVKWERALGPVERCAAVVGYGASEPVRRLEKDAVKSWGCGAMAFLLAGACGVVKWRD